MRALDNVSSMGMEQLKQRQHELLYEARHFTSINDKNTTILELIAADFELIGEEMERRKENGRS